LEIANLENREDANAINNLVLGLIQASVINGRIRDGSPVDWFGRPYDIQVTAGNVTCSTRGLLFGIGACRHSSPVKPRDPTPN
jgi:hypothetical protein